MEKLWARLYLWWRGYCLKHGTANGDYCEGCWKEKRSRVEKRLAKSADRCKRAEEVLGMKDVIH